MIEYSIQDRSNTLDVEFLQKVDQSGYIQRVINGNDLSSRRRKMFTVKECSISDVIGHLEDEFSGSTMRLSNTAIIVPDSQKYIIECEFAKRNKYLTLRLKVFYKYNSQFKKVTRKIKERLSDNIVEATFVDFTWAFKGKKGTRYSYFSDPITEIFHSEGYPFITDFDSFCDKYMKSSSSVLVLKGRPGTGKTKFIRYLLRQYAKTLTNRMEVLYVSNKETLKQEDVFIEFLNGGFRFLVIEDADEALKSRKSGNSVMTNLLTAADGIISNINKKIIITTNLPNINDIDDALVRPGRCYDRIQFGFLDNQEADAAIQAITGGEVTTVPEEMREEKYTLAEVYEIVNNIT